MNSFLKNQVFSISFGTALSKLVGFARQLFIAAAFGVGITYDAYNYAYIIPGFLLIIIGGINGPLHNAVVAIITPLSEKKASSILTRVSIKITLFLLIVSIFVFFNAELLNSVPRKEYNVALASIKSGSRVMALFKRLFLFSVLTCLLRS